MAQSQLDMPASEGATPSRQAPSVNNRRVENEESTPALAEGSNTAVVGSMDPPEGEISAYER